MILQGDCLEVLKTLSSESVDCCVTSPPYYGLRDYGHDSQIGLESTPDEYVSKLVQVFSEVKRILKPEGTLWLNLGDSYATKHLNGTTDEKTGWKHGELSKDYHGRAGGIGNGVKPKDLIGIPWMVAFALRADGWYLRQDIIWHKPNPMPESVTDRCTKSHEYIFLLAKSQRYYYDQEAIKEESVDFIGTKKRYESNFNAFNGGLTTGAISRNNPIAKLEFDGTRNKRDVWTVTTKPYSEAHFATYPPDLIEPCILAGCPKGGIVLDPFFGSGTTGLVATNLQREFIGIELNPDYIELAKKRIYGELYI
jgi:DNA modification methylase